MNVGALFFLTWSLGAHAAPYSDDAVADQAAAIRAEQPELASTVDARVASRNRAGGYYFVGGVAQLESAQVLWMDRLIQGQDPVPVQVAIAYGLTEPQPWAMIENRSEPIRVALLAAHKRKADPSVLVTATKDRSADVVAEAVRLLGYASPESSASVNPALEQALLHDVGEVRRLAVRALGWRGDVASFERVSKLLNDPRPGVREAAVRALGRLDQSRAAGLQELIALEHDVHPGTVRAVRRVMAP